MNEEDGAGSPLSEGGPGLFDGRVPFGALPLGRGSLRAGVRGRRRPGDRRGDGLHRRGALDGSGLRRGGHRRCVRRLGGAGDRGGETLDVRNHVDLHRPRGGDRHLRAHRISVRVKPLDFSITSMGTFIVNRERAMSSILRCPSIRPSMRPSAHPSRHPSITIF